MNPKFLKKLLLLLLILSFLIDGVKISFKGRVGLGLSNSIYLIEILMILIMLSMPLWVKFSTRIRLKKLEISYFVTFSSILFLLTIIFIFNFDMSQIMGEGNFRLVSIILTFGIGLICIPLDRRETRMLVRALIAIAFLNAAYSIALASGFLSPLDSFNYGYRGGQVRFSGFSKYPSYIATLCAAAFGASLPYCFQGCIRSRLINLIILSVCFLGVATSQSRCGAVGLVMCICFYIYLAKKMLTTIPKLIFTLTIATILIFYFMPEDYDHEFVLKAGSEEVRYDGYINSVIISMHQPWGIPMGSYLEYEQRYNPNKMCGVGEPHSGIAQLLLYGGVLSFILYCIFNLRVFMRIESSRRRLSLTTQSCYLAYLGTCGIFFFEQGLYMSVVLFFHIVLLALAVKSHSSVPKNQFCPSTRAGVVDSNRDRFSNFRARKD